MSVVVIMPRFLLPIVILSFISVVGFGYVVLEMSPDQTVAVILFLVTFFLSLTFALSLTFFFLHKKFFFKPKSFTALGPVISEDDLRPLFRTSLRNAILVALLAVTLLVLQRFL